MRNTLTVVFVLFCVSLQAQWQLVHPASPLHRLFIKAVVPPGSTECYAVGNDLAISVDGGVSWQRSLQNHLPVNLTPDSRYYDLQFVSATTAYFLFENRIYKTTDRGAHWNVVLESTQTHPKYFASAIFSSIFFLNEQNGYAVGDFAKLYQTSDGGQTWKVLSATTATAPFVSYSDVVFTDNLTGYISGYDVATIEMNYGFTEFVLKTTDGGTTWKRWDLPAQTDARIINLRFVDADHGFATFKNSKDNDELFATIDGGQSWNPVNPPGLRAIKTLHWIDGKTAVAFGTTSLYDNEFFRTENGGTSWEPISLPVFPQQDINILTDIAFVDANNGFAVGAAGNILRTNDKGKTWRSANEGYPFFHSLSFPSKNVGYASSGKGFFKTTDGGATWTFQHQSESLTVLNMQFVSETDGMLYGFKNFYYRVSQGGADIDLLTLPVNFLSLSELVQSGDSVFIAGTALAPFRQVLLRSGDRGETWETTTLSDERNLIFQVQRIHNRFYYTSSVTITRSGSRGQSPETVFTTNNGYLNAVHFLDEQTALAFFTSGEMKRSSDGGVHWQTVGSFDVSMLIKDFIKVNDRVVYAYGSKNNGNYVQGAVWISTDAGLHWREEQLPPVDFGISDMAVAGDFVFATGGYGIILRTTVPEEVTHVAEIPDSDARLYPNPTHDFLTLSITPDHQLESVAVVALNGSRLMAAAEETEKNGYRIAVNHLSDGLYVLEVKTSGGYWRKRFVKASLFR
ncbi:YCF48-related protein [Chryseolinea lacunae]|uniref:T9SS type A sorting domain-containing protein n=1 Tax=Chryseolinea lacunae TaxID=2801331 RepID=A0ABS1KVJ2_9BACT|nr:YCF48-related protein [Chryseolinea lacunae]MBL0743470.1 T9SS type A sorting domain-containing protein [Chryseolinea lacunae]